MRRPAATRRRPRPAQLAIATRLHSDSAVRAAGNRAEERVIRFSAEFAADPRVARAFAAPDTI